MIYWITGRAGAGKTTKAVSLRCELHMQGCLDVVILDGDVVRMFFPAGYTNEEREAHIMHTAKIAALLELQGFTVIIAMISPKKKWRMEARKLFSCSELIYIPGGTLWPGTEYEEPDREELAINYSNLNNKGGYYEGKSQGVGKDGK